MILLFSMFAPAYQYVIVYTRDNLPLVVQYLNDLERAQICT